MRSIIGLFPLRNGVFLIISIKWPMGKNIGYHNGVEVRGFKGKKQIINMERFHQKLMELILDNGLLTYYLSVIISKREKHKT